MVTAGAPEAIDIERDSLGVVTVSARSAAGSAYGLGFAHAQDRYFQMDLARRLAAGELSELFGAVALPQDRKARVFLFRQRAQQVIADASESERAWIDGYTRGANAGLASLRSRPWEYWILRSAPLAWRSEDSVLVVYSMWWQLQYSDLAREQLRHDVANHLSDKATDSPLDDAGAALRFLFPRGTEWDAPLVTSAAGAMVIPTHESPPVPAPEALDLRGPPAAIAAPATLAAPGTPAAGSNNWAVAGRLTATGSALVASDMHLGLSVPAAWYRARLRFAGTDITGATLPGTPGVVAGSNGQIAWGFTNSYGDWSDITPVDCDLTTRHYGNNSGSFTVSEQVLHVKGGADEPLQVFASPLGVLIETRDAGRTCLLARWLALERGATNLRLLELNRAASVAETLRLAPGTGIPHQNMVVGDRAGHIAWTVAGRIPAGERGPSTPDPVGWREAIEQPAVVDPDIGRIWTANARVVDGPIEQVIGGDEAQTGLGYDLGARAGQIRDDLLHLSKKATPVDMLHIQLDDRAIFLHRWRDLLLSILDQSALANHPRRAEFRQLIEGWNGRASVDSVGYRLLHEFRNHTERATWGMLMTGLSMPADTAAPRQFEGPLWRLVTEQPDHLLAREFADWHTFLLIQVDAALEQLRSACPRLDRCTWGQHAVVHIKHPLSRALPFLSWLIDMPATPLPGDHDMPRVQDGAFGASERFAVSPGHESEGYFELPGGQSGHPLSPWYRSEFASWANGTLAPFLPGATQHKLRIAPAAPR